MVRGPEDPADRHPSGPIGHDGGSGPNGEDGASRPGRRRAYPPRVEPTPLRPGPSGPFAVPTFHVDPVTQASRLAVAVQIIEAQGIPGCRDQDQVDDGGLRLLGVDVAFDLDAVAGGVDVALGAARAQEAGGDHDGHRAAE